MVDATGVRTALPDLLGRFVHANVVVASGTTAVALTTALLLGLPVEPMPLAFVWVAAWFAYTANRFTDRAEDRANVPGRAAFIAAYGRPMLFAGAGAYAIAIGLTGWIAPRMLPVALVPVAGAGLYTTEVCRRRFALKNGVVGLVWAMIPFGLGLYYGVAATPGMWLIAGTVGGHIALAAMLFDIKDIAGDRQVGTRTLPVRVGAERTRRAVRFGALVLAAVVAVGAVWLEFGLAILAVYPGHLLATSRFATETRGSLFYGLAIDGEHLVVAAVAIVALT